MSFPSRAGETNIDLARRYGPTPGVRTLDSLHVACALELKAERFWTFDERQVRLARAAGLDTNPFPDLANGLLARPSIAA